MHHEYRQAFHRNGITCLYDLQMAAYEASYKTLFRAEKNFLKSLFTSYEVRKSLLRAEKQCFEKFV